ncbi:hypothetical protein [Vreelandella aquamarina]|uniref:hypothetical protein n=1 Tax=Vreelandella aquamarina TaxID=77097 RepID=UPI0007836353|nr:hypothetical protein [Halomonas axialensis]
MNRWRVTSGYLDAALRMAFTVTKGTRRLDHRDQNELEALLNPWADISIAPKDGTRIILRRGEHVTTGSWLVWGDKRPTYTERGDPAGEVKQEPGAMWCISDPAFTEDQPPTSWMPL